MPFLCHLAIFVPGGAPSARPRVPGSPDPCLPVLFPIQEIFLGPLPGAGLRPLVLSFRISYSGASSDTARRPPTVRRWAGLSPSSLLSRRALDTHISRVFIVNSGKD